MNPSDEMRVAPVSEWLAMPMEMAARRVIERVRRADDVVCIAVMPDVHLAGDVCVGTVMATRRLIYPSAVGGDIGCGMLALAFDSSADALRDARNAGAILRLLGERIPAQRRNRARTLPLPDGLKTADLSHPSLRAFVVDEGRLQFGTLGGGNHFVELQSDETDRLWLMIHSGSRAVGQQIKDHYLGRATVASGSMAALDADAVDGQAYLHDQDWARQFAEGNRQAMAHKVVEILRAELRIEPIESSMTRCDHNHVRREAHLGERLLIHRKGAMPAASGMPGVIPGSMGTKSFHVEGRGCAEALLSSAHGAGRLYSRHAARERFNRASLMQQMQGIWFDPRIAEALREESPRSYKDVNAVMRAQRDLVKVVRTVEPVLVYKGR